MISIDEIKLSIDDRRLSRQNPEYKRIYRTVNTVIDGEFWEHVKPLSHESLKLTGFRERFVNGMEWEETSLFTDYNMQLMRKVKVQGCYSLDELVDLYKRQHDTLYHRLVVEGVKSARGNVNITPIYVYINKDGEFVFTSGGNHRLNMAKVIGLKAIPVRVRGRHVEWQRIRDELYNVGSAEFFNRYPHFERHPDLVD
ncbi:hypothetical protein [Pseudomonas profundi]|uniref:hypothetical protein n=1 Tax=Pseudomonas profundi TaxID=1981513 RepID=UPI001239A4E2|nr:hypothetical protein [Pseudomonas profundi]